MLISVTSLQPLWACLVVFGGDVFGVEDVKGELMERALHSKRWRQRRTRMMTRPGFHPLLDARFPEHAGNGWNSSFHPWTGCRLWCIHPIQAATKPLRAPPRVCYSSWSPFGSEDDMVDYSTARISGLTDFRRDLSHPVLLNVKCWQRKPYSQQWPQSRTRPRTQPGGSSGLLAGLPGFHTLLDARLPALDRLSFVLRSSNPGHGQAIVCPTKGMLLFVEVLFAVRTTLPDMTIIIPEQRGGLIDCQSRYDFWTYWLSCRNHPVRWSQVSLLLLRNKTGCLLVHAAENVEGFKVCHQLLLFTSFVSSLLLFCDSKRREIWSGKKTTSRLESCLLLRQVDAWEPVLGGEVEIRKIHGVVRCSERREISPHLTEVNESLVVTLFWLLYLQIPKNTVGAQIFKQKRPKCPVLCKKSKNRLFSW